jgi:hypothetical protein
MVIRVYENQDPDGPFSGFAFFYSKDWSLFLFLKGGARLQGRALISDACR